MGIKGGLNGWGSPITQRNCREHESRRGIMPTTGQHTVRFTLHIRVCHTISRLALSGAMGLCPYFDEEIVGRSDVLVQACRLICDGAWVMCSHPSAKDPTGFVPQPTVPPESAASGASTACRSAQQGTMQEISVPNLAHCLRQTRACPRTWVTLLTSNVLRNATHLRPSG
jgi:hypothetical protein